jgi:hypothetical protein
MIKPRMPSIDRGVSAFLWAFGLAIYVLLGMLAVGVSKATSVIFSLLTLCIVFLLVRTRGRQDVVERR